ncbi:MAG: phytanoyl-CoA dioxygenase family protein [SAR324 cluster bacterium]|nr:phytanoyl-CoA dioxygenase family protein [SAR324 cluster bacterium]
MRAEAVAPSGWRLGARELETYRGDGLVVPPFRFEGDWLERLRSGTERLVAENPDIRPEALDTAHIVNNPTSPVIGNTELLDFALGNPALELVQQLIGPDIILWNTHLFLKPPGDGKEVPWHQDGQYWPIRPLATCSLWIALDQVDEENGALRYVPGSHSGRVYAHHTDNDERLSLNQVLDEGQLPLQDAPLVKLGLGEFSLHDVYLVHGSAANRSTRRRSGFAIRYMPASSLFDHGIRRGELKADFSQRPLWLVRGRDRAGNDFQTGHGDGSGQHGKRPARSGEK